MHYKKCGVNRSLHNSGCCISFVAPWITVLSRCTVFTERVIYYKFTFVQYSAKRGTTHRPTSHLAHCVPFLWPREDHGSADELLISLASVCCDDFSRGLLLLLFLFFFLLKIVFPLLASAPDSPSRCQQPEFHCWLPPQVLFIFFRPLLDTHNHLPCLGSYV